MKLAFLAAMAGTVAATAAVAGILATPASAAPAATSTPAVASSIDGSDPSSTGCSSGAFTAKSAYAYRGSTKVALVELRYSPHCRTTWARVTTMNVPNCITNTNWCGDATVHRNSDGKAFTCYTPNGGHGCYTKQVDDHNVTSYARGTLDDGIFHTAVTGSY